MLIAQAIAEYGGGIVLAQAFERLGVLVDRVRHAEPSTWAIVAVVAVGIWLFIGRSR